MPDCPWLLLSMQITLLFPSQVSDPYCESVWCSLLENKPVLAPAAAPLSHGFGGDTVAILIIMRGLYLLTIGSLSLSTELIV